MQKNNSIHIFDIPEDILQNNIMIFLNLNDLFHSVREVCIDWAEALKEVYTEKMNLAITKQLKSAENSYERECLLKLVDKKTLYLNNYKSMLNIYTNNNALNLSTLLLINFINDEMVKSLLTFFLNFLGLIEPVQLMSVSIEELTNYFNENNNEIKDKVEIFTSMDPNVISGYTVEKLYKLKDDFEKLDQNHLEDASDASKIIYCFLSYVIVFLILKQETIEENRRINELNEKLKVPVFNWQEKQFYYEGAYKFVNFSK